MTERTRKRIVISTLPLVIIWAAFNLGDKKKAALPPAPPPTIAAITPSANPAPAVSDQDSGRIENLRNAAWGDDPFRLKPAAGANTGIFRPSSPTLKLSGILYSAENPIAIINGGPVKVGQKISGATVKVIERDKVILDRQGKEQTLSVFKG